LCGQSLVPVAAAEDPAVTAAKKSMQLVQQLVEAGALPRVRLEQAQQAVADAQDIAFLRKTLYGQKLTVDDADEMIAVTKRRLERSQKQADQQQKLVEEGVISRAEMTTSLDDVDRARTEYNLALSRANLMREIASMAKVEADAARQMENSPTHVSNVAERFDGSGVFSPGDFQTIEAAFQKRFFKPLPVSAFGETAVHQALGFDHRGRVDVALNPDQPEGRWLRSYLQKKDIPYFAFRAAVAHKATGAHIHIGPQSTRCHPCVVNAD
jgi:hypothetical protein